MTIIWCVVPEIWSVTDKIFCHFGSFFCLFTHLTTQKFKIFKKLKKDLDILSFYTSVPQITIIWCMVPKISSVTDRIFWHFGQFFTHLPPKTIHFEIFLPFYPPNLPEKWKFQKNEKKNKPPGDIIILQSAPKIMIICNIVPEIWRVTNTIVFILGYILPFYP